MKKFIGTKIVKADYTPVTWKKHYENMGRNWPEAKEGAEHIGYKIGYSDDKGNFNGEKEDGCEYISWSPEDVFNAAYRSCNAMTFGLAVEAMKMGYKVARDGWNGNDMHLEVQFSDKHNKMTHPYLFMTIPECSEGIRLLPWQPAQVDIFAEDWVIVE